jgi:hypothetical protein
LDEELDAGSFFVLLEPLLDESVEEEVLASDELFSLAALGGVADRFVLLRLSVL